MASTPVTQGNPIISTDNGPNNLFARLEAMRASHLTASQQAGTSTTGITSAFPTAPISRGDLATRAATPNALSTEVQAIISSGSFQANKGSSFTQTNISPIPAIGDLISAANFNAWNTTITNMENVCPNYTRYGTQYGTRYGSQYGSRYGYKYSGEYGSRYGTQYSWYTQRYSRAACLMKGTKILLANNRLKEIENIKINDEVCVWNELTNKMEIKKVNKFSEHPNTKEMIEILFSNGNKLQLTKNHPILSTNGWKSKSPKESLSIHGVYTSELKIGDEILTPKGKINITDIKNLSNEEDYFSYNLEIDNIHNFITEGGIITHNSKYNIAG